MSSPDEYISPLMARGKPEKPSGPAKVFTLPCNQVRKDREGELQQFRAVYKVDPSWPKALIEKLTNSHCWVCNVKMTSMQNARSHYEGKNHRKSIDKWLLNHGSETEEANTNNSSNTTDDPESENQMVRPATSLSNVPTGPELNPFKFGLDCTNLPKMHIHSDGSIDGKANVTASDEEIAKISSCLIKYILKECLKAKKNKEKEKNKAKKRKHDGEEKEDENAVGKIIGRHRRIAFYSLTMNKELWLHRNKVATRVPPTTLKSPLQNELAITEAQIDLAEFGSGDSIGGGRMILNFEIHIWQNTQEPYRILVTGKPFGSAIVQSAMWKPMFSFFTSMVKRHLPKAIHWVNGTKDKEKEKEKKAMKSPDKATSMHQSTDTAKNANPPKMPSKVVPNNAASMHPLMVLNQMRPGIEFASERTVLDNNQSKFNVSVTIDGREFRAEGPNIKKAKANLAKDAIYRLFGVESTFQIPA